MKNIVLISQNRAFFGAQIVHVPLLKVLKSKYPDCKIHYFSKTKVSEILLSLNLIDHLIIEKSKKNFVVEYQKTSADLTINLRQKSLFHTATVALLNRKRKIGFSNSVANIFFNHVLESNTSIYRADNYLSLLDEKIPYSLSLKKKQICIAPGSGGNFKIWSIENYIQLAKDIMAKRPNYTVIFILGEKERNYVEQLAPFITIMNENVRNLFKTIEQSELMITNDCGPSHIGHISSTKVISIFSDEYHTADSTIKEWFNNKQGSFAIKGEKGKTINSVPVQAVLDKVYDTISNPNENTLDDIPMTLSKII